MKKSVFQLNFLFWSFLSIFLFTGFSPFELVEIQRAIMSYDYDTAQQFALAGLDDEVDKTMERKLNYYLALTYLHQRDFERAREIFRDLKGKSLKNGLKDKVILGLMDTYILDERFEDAVRVGKDYLQDDEESDYGSQIYLKLASAQLKCASWQEAQTNLKYIVDQYPNSLEYFNARQLLGEKSYFAVQVGSFRDRERAAGLVEELQRQGEYAYLVETQDRHDHTYYRVRVGQLSALAEAKLLKSKLAEAGYPTRIFP